MSSGGGGHTQRPVTSTTPDKESHVLSFLRSLNLSLPIFSRESQNSLQGRTKGFAQSPRTG